MEKEKEIENLINLEMLCYIHVCKEKDFLQRWLRRLFVVYKYLKLARFLGPISDGNFGLEECWITLGTKYDAEVE